MEGQYGGWGCWRGEMKGNGGLEGGDGGRWGAMRGLEGGMAGLKGLGREMGGMRGLEGGDGGSGLGWVMGQFGVN